jgi:hypothetical protein
MPSSTFSTQPDCNVVFFPYAQEDTFGVDIGDVVSESDLSPLNAYPDIIECTTSKPKGGVGTFSVLLSSRIDYKAAIHPGCWCMIYMSNQKLTGNETSEEDSGLKMIGIVRSVRTKEVINPDTGTRMVRYLIAGEDFQSVFNTQIYVNANLYSLGQGSGVDTFSLSLVIFGPQLRQKEVTSPDQIISALISSFLGSPGFQGSDSPTVSKISIGGGSRQGQPYVVPSSMSMRLLGEPAPQNLFTGILTQFITPKPMLGTIQALTDISGTPTIWSVLQTFSHQILNEMYTDILPAEVNGAIRMVPCFVFRPIPFNSKHARSDIKVTNQIIQFNDANSSVTPPAGTRNLKNGTIISSTQRLAAANRPSAHFYISRIVQEYEIFSFDYGKSDLERHNLIFVPSNLAGSTADSEAALLRQLIGGDFKNVGDPVSIGRYGLRPYISYDNYMNGTKGSDIFMINKIVRDLWFNAHLYQNGTVSIMGTREHIPVGTNLLFNGRGKNGWIAHVEQVDNNFLVDQSSGKKMFRTNIAFTRLQNPDGTSIQGVALGQNAPEGDDINAPGTSGIVVK